MSLQTRLDALIGAIGADIRALSNSTVRTPVTALDKVRAILPTSRSKPLVVLTLGHSFVAGNGATREDARWVNQLASRLQAAYPSGVAGWEPPVRTLSDSGPAPSKLPGMTVVNGGIPGAFSNTYVPAATLTQVTALQPPIVIHMIGVNDYQLGVSKANFKNYVTASINSVDAACTVPPVHVLVDSYAQPSKTGPITPWASFVEAMAELSAAAPDRVAHISTVKEFELASASGPSAPDPLNLVDADNLHPSNNGHAMIAQLVGAGLRIPPPPTVWRPEIFDRFNRSAMGSAETGQPWSVQAGTFAPTVDGLGCTVAGQVIINGGFSDAEISAVIVHQSSALQQLVLKSSSATTGIRVAMGATNDNVLIWEGDTLKTFSGALGLSVGQEYLFAASVKGDRVSIHINNEEVFWWGLTPAQVTAYTGKTLHGIRVTTPNAAVKYRNLAVRPV